MKTSFIDVRKFATLDDLVAEIKEIDEDDDRWLAMRYMRSPMPSSLTTVETIYQSWEEETAEFLYHIFDQDYAPRRFGGTVLTGERRLPSSSVGRIKLYGLIDNKGRSFREWKSAFNGG